MIDKTYIALAELARILNVKYHKVYNLTFEVDFPVKRHGGGWFRRDIYNWLEATGRKTADEILSLQALDKETTDERLIRQREYNARQKRLSRARKAGRPA